MKTALVTGTGCDIGREVALNLGSRGYKILTHGRMMKQPLEDTHNCLKRRIFHFQRITLICRTPMKWKPCAK